MSFNPIFCSVMLNNFEFMLYFYSRRVWIHEYMIIKNNFFKNIVHFLWVPTHKIVKQAKSGTGRRPT
jgi:hypothetical protein